MEQEHRSYEVLQDASASVPIKMWTRGVPVDDASKRQLINTASMPFIYRWLAVMPDVHYGIGATVGSVIPTRGAIIPAAVGVDIGCGMMAVRTTLAASDLPDSLARDAQRRSRRRCRTAAPTTAAAATRARGRRFRRRREAWRRSRQRFQAIVDEAPASSPRATTVNHLGTLGTGNHFIEVCLDEATACGSCCTRARAASATASARYFIELAKEDMRRCVQEPAR